LKLVDRWADYDPVRQLDGIGGGLPFTTDQFFEIFALYNRAFLGVVVALWLASAGTLALAWRDPARRSGMLSVFLGVLWLWNAVAYHAVFFTRINPAAWIFAAMFLIQAGLFSWAAAGGHIAYFSSTGWRHGVGLGLVAYALAYPFLTMALGHRYPETPTFGVPCPTAILTIGLLVSAGGRVPVILAIVPIVWGFIGGSAAALLGVPTDYALLGAAPLLAVTLVGRRTRLASARR
jgi:hypothetical protein